MSSIVGVVYEYMSFIAGAFLTFGLFFVMFSKNLAMGFMWITIACVLQLSNGFASWSVTGRPTVGFFVVFGVFAVAAGVMGHFAHENRRRRELIEGHLDRYARPQRGHEMYDR